MSPTHTDPPLVALVGPTASGKSSLALTLAEERSGEIVSCDSQQVYRGLDVGTAKATPEERRRVRHHLLDVVAPDGVFSAADYARLAREALSGIRERGRLPLVVGGTGLYLRALVEGLFEGPARDEPLRRRLEAVAGRRGDAWLHGLLRRLDAEAASRIEARDRVRVVRALEVRLRTGRPIGEQQRSGGTRLEGFAVRVFGLCPGREELRRRVEARAEAMIRGGLLEEAQVLLRAGFSPELRPLRAIGYRQAFQVLRGEATVEQARRGIVVETMRYAKRQMTWFRHQAEVEWHAGAGSAADAVRGWLDGQRRD